MSPNNVDDRSAEQKLRDEQAASKPPLPPPELPPDAVARPVEEHLRKIRRRPQAILGVVENGLIRPVDPAIRLPERTSVIIVMQVPP